LGLKRIPPPPSTPVLIKLLIINHLGKTSRTWENFLFYGGFFESFSSKLKTNKRKKQIKVYNPVHTVEIPKRSTSYVLRNTRNTYVDKCNENLLLIPMIERVSLRKGKKVLEENTLASHQE